MTAPTFGSDAAFRVADQLHRAKVPAPWEVFGERIERYEVHFTGAGVEMRRGPMRLEGAGVRVLRPVEEATGIGFAASSDLSERSIAELVREAEAMTRHTRFPAPRPDLPGAPVGVAEVESYDAAAWSRPPEALDEYLDVLLGSFDGIPDAGPTFGSVHLTLSESTLSNSSGLQHRAARTETYLEVGVKASGGPEGRPPGEYWVVDRSVRLDSAHLPSSARDWCRKAQDVRSAKPPTAGPQNVVLPARVLSDVLPVILGFRFSGAAELRKIAPAAGTTVGSPSVSIADDGTFPYGIASSALDAEGHVQRKRDLVVVGRAAETMYDVLHGSASGKGSSGNGLRHSVEYPRLSRFDTPPSPEPTTLVVQGGDLGGDAEVAEAAGEGIWVDQLGFPFPDPLSAAFGGEVRLGYRIRGGKLAEPVRGGTVGGIVMGAAGDPSLLNSVVGLGRHRTTVPHLSAPTMVVSGLTVGAAD